MWCGPHIKGDLATNPLRRHHTRTFIHDLASNLSGIVGLLQGLHNDGLQLPVQLADVLRCAEYILLQFLWCKGTPETHFTLASTDTSPIMENNADDDQWLLFTMFSATIFDHPIPFIYLLTGMVYLHKHSCGQKGMSLCQVGWWCILYIIEPILQGL